MSCIRKTEAVACKQCDMSVEVLKDHLFLAGPFIESERVDVPEYGTRKT